MQTFWLEQTLGDVPADDGWLAPCERTRLAELKVAKRRQDWRLGRWTAKCAVCAFEGHAVERKRLLELEVRAADDGSPYVLLEGEPARVSISISHRAGVGACAVSGSPESIGCDLEVIEPRSAAFVEDYFTDHEARILEDADPADRWRTVAAIWSAKESVLKAVRQGLREDTRSVSVECLGEGRGDWHALTAVYAGDATYAGWWRSGGGLVRTVVASPPSPAPIPLRIEQAPRLTAAT